MSELVVSESVGVVSGCPGGPGHPSGASTQLVLGTVADILDSVNSPRFLTEVKPGLLIVCQCELAEIIQALAVQIRESRTDA